MLTKVLRVLVIVSVTVTLVCCSCGSTRVANRTVRESSADTVCLTNIKYDSIYVYQSHDRDYRPGVPDTVFIKDVSVEYRYKLLRDTVRIVRRDSIPYEVTIVETRDITRPRTWFDHLARGCCWSVIGVVFALFVRFVFKNKIPGL